MTDDCMTGNRHLEMCIHALLLWAHYFHSFSSTVLSLIVLCSEISQEKQTDGAVRLFVSMLWVTFIKQLPVEREKKCVQKTEWQRKWWRDRDKSNGCFLFHLQSRNNYAKWHPNLFSWASESHLSPDTVYISDMYTGMKVDWSSCQHYSYNLHCFVLLSSCLSFMHHWTHALNI